MTVQRTFSLNHLRASGQHDAPSFLVLQGPQQWPTSNDHNMTIKLRKLTLRHYCHSVPRLYASFTNCTNNFLCIEKIQSWTSFGFSCHVSLISFNLEQFLSFLTCKTVILLKITGQFFCRMSLNWSLSDGSSWLGSGYFCQEYHIWGSVNIPFLIKLLLTSLSIHWYFLAKLLLW